MLRVLRRVVTHRFLSRQSPCSRQPADTETAHPPPWGAISSPALCPHAETGPAQREDTHCLSHTHKPILWSSAVGIKLAAVSVSLVKLVQLVDILMLLLVCNWRQKRSYIYSNGGLSGSTGTPQYWRWKAVLHNENPTLQVWELPNGAGNVLWEELLQPIGRNQCTQGTASD